MYSVHVKYQMTNICIKLDVCPSRSITTRYENQFPKQKKYCLRSLPVRTRILKLFKSSLQSICKFIRSIVFKTMTTIRSMLSLIK